MFRSSLREVVIPQSEHLKLAGSLALLWGNSRFVLPPLPHLSVVAGVGLHDRAYGHMDNIPVGEVDDESWLALTRHGFYMPCADTIADIIARHHLLRLVEGKKSPARDALAEEMQQVIQRQIEDGGLQPALFARIDHMTELCDTVSFYFCREAPAEGAIDVSPRSESDETLKVRYGISGREITLDPWPLAIDRYEGYLVGYKMEGYPERPDGLAIPYRLRRP